jgi:hypothetical protein
MSINRFIMIFLFVAVGAMILFVQPAWATPPPPDPTVEFSILAGTSSPSGVAPVVPNPNADPYKYEFSIPSGGALLETIPILVCLVSVDNPGGFTWTDTVAVDNITSGVPGTITVNPMTWTFTETSPVRDSDAYPNPSNDPACKSGTVTIDTGTQTNNGAVDIVYTSNITFKTQDGTSSNPTNGKGKVTDSLDKPDHFQIKLTVTPTALGDRISCYITDSEGNVLQKCDGTPANESGETDGTFAIVANKKGKAVATNPGQFYYNLFWENDTGSAQTVTVSFALSGLMSNGTQALHWLTFPTIGGVNLNDFNAVIEGNPAGANGPISNIEVPANHTLYVTYHLEWVGLGSNVGDYGSCGEANNTPVSLTGTVSGSFSGSPDTCMAGALGYNKK